MEHRLIPDASIAADSAAIICAQFEARAKEGAAEKGAAKGEAKGSAKGTLLLALSGGSSPRALYAEISARMPQKVAERISIIQVDERAVHPSHEDSNARLIRESAAGLLEKGAKFHPVPLLVSGALQQPKTAAKEYALLTQKLFDSAAYAFAILGAGADGHTASIFPDASEEEKKAAAANSFAFASTAEHLGYYRISLTYHAIFSCDNVLMYVPGAAKKDIVSRLVSPEDTEKYPASYVMHTHPNAMLVSSA